MAKSAISAGVAILFGFVLWLTSLGTPWVDTSYDYLFRLGARNITNQITLILMDNGAFEHFQQNRGEPWDRALHAQLLNRLADDDCAMVVFDSFFHLPRDPVKDAGLSNAMARQKKIVLMAEQAELMHPEIAGAKPIIPAAMFLAASRTNWGVAWLDPDLDGIVRKHWPYPAPAPYPSLTETAARVIGVPVNKESEKRWLRYYNPSASWNTISYQFALTQPKGFFKDQIVFIGTQPKTTIPDRETDEFLTPFYRWTGQSSGGVQIIATAFLNLINHDWLQRAPAWFEITLLIVCGAASGWVFSGIKPIPGVIVGFVASALVTFTGIIWSYYTNQWTAWLIVAGGQIPCAWIASRVTSYLYSIKNEITPGLTPLKTPVVPGYRLFQPPIGQGAYGKVWLARNTAGEWKAIKAVYLANFENHLEPYEREYQGVSKYLPICELHPGLLRIGDLHKDQDGYFYYAMELADSVVADWEKKTDNYKVHDLAAECSLHPNKRIPVSKCVDIGMSIAEALHFLHQKGFTHRDIKPKNIVYVGGLPKLGDLGLITEIRPDDLNRTLVGTPGFMPPPPESPGTPQADIFGLGMVLYVISTGRDASSFPDLPTQLVTDPVHSNYILLNSVIIKACHPDRSERFQSAEEVFLALKALKPKLSPHKT